MHLLIVRHGYTFGSDQQGGEKEILCGCKQNIPLVKRGREKARLLAKQLHEKNWQPDAAYSNKLLRTWEHACIIREYFWQNNKIEFPIYTNDTFLELDYGDWAGLVTSKENNQVIVKFGNSAWDNWQKQRIFPKGMPHNWQLTEQELILRIKVFFQNLVDTHQRNEKILILASQGSMAFLHSVLDGGMAKARREEKNLKTAPGNFCELIFKDNIWNLIRWNVDPNDF